MGQLRAFLAHDLCAAVRARGDVRGGSRQSRLAGLAHVRADSRSDGLRADLCDGVQSHRGPQIRRAKSTHSEPSSACWKNFLVQRGPALGHFRRRIDRRQLFSEPTLFLPFARRAGGDLFLFADQTVHGLHARFSWNRSRTRANRRMVGRERSKPVRLGNVADGHAGVRGRAVAGRLRHHLRAARSRVRQVARTAFARRRVGAGERPDRCVPRAHGNVRISVRVRDTLPVSRRVYGRVVHHHILPADGTLDRAAQKLELDQHCFFPAQRRGKRGVFPRGRGGGDLQRRLSDEVSGGTGVSPVCFVWRKLSATFAIPSLAIFH